MTVISLYSGGGGIEEGMKQAGIYTDIAIDNCHKFPLQDPLHTIKLNHPDTEVICGNVGDFIESLPKADIVVGGPPCPEFSRANSNRSFDMCEVNNFWKVVERLQPKIYLMENVQDVKKKLWKGNYLINSADYGVPQTRLRRFFTNLPRPEPTHAENPYVTLSGMSMKKWISVKEALGLDAHHLEDRKTKFGEAEFRKYSMERPSPTETADTRFFIVDNKFPGRNALELTKPVEGPSMTVLANNDLQITDHRIFSTKYLKEKNPTMFDKRKPNEMDDVAFTVTSKDRSCGSDMVTDGSYARKLTNEELALLQGFPKEYKFYGSKTSVRRQIGNAVPPPVIKAFFSQVTVKQILVA